MGYSGDLFSLDQQLQDDSNFLCLGFDRALTWDCGNILLFVSSVFQRLADFCHWSNSVLNGCI